MSFTFIPLFILIVFILMIINRDKPNTPKMKAINKSAYGIWLLSFVFFMIKLGDGSRLQVPAALIFIGITILAMFVLLGVQLTRLINK